MTQHLDTAIHQVFLEGSVRPGPHRGCTPDRVRALIRERWVLASVVRDEPDALDLAAGLGVDELDIRICVAADAQHRVLVSGDDGPAPGPSLADFAADLAAATGCDVDLHDEFHAGYDAASVPDESSDSDEPVFVEVDEPDPELDVLLCRSSPDVLPFLARDVGSALTAYRYDGWSIIRFHEISPALHEHGWLARETPAVALSGFGGQRYLSVLVGRGILPGQATLTRQTMLATTYTADEVAPTTRPLLEALHNPHLRPESQLAELLSQAPFEHLDLVAVAHALQSPADDEWFARVLTALELPVAAARVFAGEALPDPVEVEPAGLWSALRAAARQSLDATDDDPSKLGVLQRAHTATVRRPWLTLWTIIPELLIAGPLLAWVLAADDRTWWMIALGVVGVLLLIDAVFDLVLLAIRLRRRT